MRAFNNIHPIAAFLYFAALIFSAMFLNHPVILAEVFLGGILFLLVLTGVRDFLNDFVFYLLFFITIALFNPLFSHSGITPIFFLNGNPITLESILYGVSAAAMIVGVIFWFGCFSRVITGDKFIYLFAKTVPKLSLILSMALRFIPVYMRQIEKINRTQKAMGLYSSKNIFKRIKNGGRVFFIILSWALENAVGTADSMRARGYGLKGRTNYSLFKFQKKDAAFLFSFAFLFSIFILLFFSGSGYFNYYPEITPVKLDLLSLLFYIIFGIIAFIPFILETEENLRWNYLISKI